MCLGLLGCGQGEGGSLGTLHLVYLCFQFVPGGDVVAFKVLFVALFCLLASSTELVPHIRCITLHLALESPRGEVSL